MTGRYIELNIERVKKKHQKSSKDKIMPKKFNFYTTSTTPIMWMKLSKQKLIIRTILILKRSILLLTNYTFTKAILINDLERTTNKSTINRCRIERGKYVKFETCNNNYGWIFRFSVFYQIIIPIDPTSENTTIH